VLIYGALQILATIETETPGVLFTHDVTYHLAASLKGIVPWSKHSTTPSTPAELSRHESSHAFTAPKTWPVSVPKARPGAHQPILWNEFGDGRARADLAPDPAPPTDLEYRPSTAISIQQYGEETMREPSIMGSSPYGLSSSPSCPVLGRDFRPRLDTTGAMPRVGGRGGLSPTEPSSLAQEPLAAALGDERGGAMREEGRARARRAKVHGFSDYKPEVGW
jgi:hypothetical protein